MLSSSELRVFRNLQDGDSIKQVAQRIGLSRFRASKVIKSLGEHGLVRIRRNGKRVAIHVSEAKHASLLRETMQRFEHIDFEELISGFALEVLFFLDEERTVLQIARKLGCHRASVYRVLKKLLARAVVGKRQGRYCLVNGLQVLHQLAVETFSYMHSKVASEFSNDVAILWQSPREFMIKTKRSEEGQHFLLTGLNMFARFGVPLLTTQTSYFIWSKTNRGLRLEDIVVHALLADRSSTRICTYALLLIAKHSSDINKNGLLKIAEKYDIKDDVRSLFDYLDTKGEKTRDHYPAWEEFSKKAHEYKVIV